MRLLACFGCWLLVLTLVIFSTADAKNSSKYSLVSKIGTKGAISRLKRSEDELVRYGSSSSSIVPEDKSTSRNVDDERWVDNTLSSIEVLGDESSATLSKRGGMDKFFGMRGKKEEAGSKRGGGAPVEGFFGMRGKKFGMSEGVKRLPGDVFYGMRGRKRAEVTEEEMQKRKVPGDYFLGMRGKKSAYGNDEGEVEETEDSKNEEKRTVPATNNNRFLGMRGKKMTSSDSSVPFPLPQYVVSVARHPSDASNEGNFRLMLNNSGGASKTNDSWFRDKPFFRNLYLHKPSYFDHKRQVGNIFIGMRG